jgi:hypothetical protein
MTRLDEILDRHVRLAIVAMWLCGVGLAGGTAIVAASRVGLGASVPYLGATLLLVGLTLGTVACIRWVLVADVIIMALQVVGVLGSAIELIRGASPIKAAELHLLGVDVRTALLSNLIYSLLATVIFVWMIARYRAVVRGSVKT